MVAELLSKTQACQMPIFDEVLKKMASLQHARQRHSVQEEVRKYQLTQTAAAGDETRKDMERLYAGSLKISTRQLYLGPFELNCQMALSPAQPYPRGILEMTLPLSKPLGACMPAPGAAVCGSYL